MNEGCSLTEQKFSVKTDRRNHRAKAFNILFHQVNATVITECETPVQHTNEPSEELVTINYDILNGLREEGQPIETPSAAKQGSASQEVGEELISTCVTPTRIKTIQESLAKPETERHLCALRLLPHFFSKEELAESNTDGSHDKKCLDTNKLNSLKILVFSKFPVTTNEEKDKAWRLIKGKINSKCRAARKIFMSDVTSPHLM